MNFLACLAIHPILFIYTSGMHTAQMGVSMKDLVAWEIRMPGEERLEQLGSEILKLFNYMEKIKTELAAIKHPKADMDHFTRVTQQLESIVETTEGATDAIMGATEEIMGKLDALGEKIEDEEAQNDLADIFNSTNKIFENCSFHDLTGQRISKIVRVMDRIEDSLAELVKVVGKESLADVPLADVEDPMDEDHDDGVPLHGPQSEGEGISQDDIDKLFG